MPNEDIAHKRLSLLIKLGLGYLTLERKTQSLSTGEFQCVHLVSELFANSRNPHTLFIFDEPSKGLSQNILNQFIDSVRGILQDESVSMIMIEHNSYMLENSDFIVDFGKDSLHLWSTLMLSVIMIIIVNKTVRIAFLHCKFLQLSINKMALTT